MTNLKPDEIAALKWLEKTFPISTTPKFVGWAEIAKGLSTAAGLPEEACESMLESLRQRGYFAGGRALGGGMFTGQITIPGQEFLRGLEVEEARRLKEGSAAKRFGRYLAVQSGPIIVQALVGFAIGAAIGWITGTLQPALLTGLASATAAGRIPPFRT